MSTCSVILQHHVLHIHSYVSKYSLPPLLSQIQDMPAVRESWFYCTFLINKANVEETRRKLNIMLPDAIRAHIEEFKKSPRFLEQLAQDAEVMREQLALDAIKDEVDGIYQELNEWKEQLTAAVRAKLTEHVDKFVAEIERYRTLGDDIRSHTGPYPGPSEPTSVYPPSWRPTTQTVIPGFTPPPTQTEPHNRKFMEFYYSSDMLRMED